MSNELEQVAAAIRAERERQVQEKADLLAAEEAATQRGVARFRETVYPVLERLLQEPLPRDLCEIRLDQPGVIARGVNVHVKMLGPHVPGQLSSHLNVSLMSDDVRAFFQIADQSLDQCIAAESFTAEWMREQLHKFIAAALMHGQTYWKP